MLQSKKNIVLGFFFVLIVAVIVLGVVFKDKIIREKGYSVVYLTTGEVYIGRLSTFRGLELHDAYSLQALKDSNDPTKNNFQLNPVREALWAPQVLRLVRSNVIFYGPLDVNSSIAKTLAQKEE